MSTARDKRQKRWRKAHGHGNGARPAESAAFIRGDSRAYYAGRKPTGTRDGGHTHRPLNARGYSRGTHVPGTTIKVEDAKAEGRKRRMRG